MVTLAVLHEEKEKKMVNVLVASFVYSSSSFHGDNREKWNIIVMQFTVLCLFIIIFEK